MGTYKFKLSERFLITSIFVAVIVWVHICTNKRYDLPQILSAPMPPPQEEPYITQPGDTTLLDEGMYRIKRGKNQYQLVIGDQRVYRKNNQLKWGKWESKPESSGIYEHVIKEKLTTRASEQAPSYKISNGDDYVSFTFEGGVVPADSFKFRTTKDGWVWKNNAGKYDVEIQTLPGRIKETITTRQETHFNWLIDANKMLNPQADGSITTGGMKIEKPTATDKNGNVVATTAKLEWNSGWWYRLAIDSMAAFPVVIDPTVIDTSTGANVGEMRSSNAVFLTARNATTASNVYTSGQVYSGMQTGYLILRYWVKFPITLPAGTQVDSALYRFYLATGGSTLNQHHNVLLVSAQHTEIVASQFTKFVGWASSGAYTGIKNLGTPTNTSSLNTSNAWNSIKLRSYALDTIEAHNNDTLRIMQTSDLDSSATAPGNHTSLGMTSTTNITNLWIYYTVSYALSCSLSVGSRFDTLRIDTYGADTTNIDSLRMFRMSGTDSIQIGTTKTTFNNNKVGGLSANTQYRIFTKGYYDSPVDSVRSNLDTIYTRPDTASVSFIVISPTAFGITPSVGANNPAGTKISIKDSTASKAAGHPVYLTLDGDTSATERFYATTSWGTVTDDDYIRGNWGIYSVRAQNDDSTYKSAWVTDSIQLPLAFDTLQFTGIDTNLIRVVFDCDTFAKGKRLRPFVYSGADTTWGDSINFNASANYDTITLTGNTPNAKRYAKVRVVDSSNVVYFSTIDSSRTYPVKPSSVSLSWVNDTTFVLTVTKHGTMPANTGYFVWDCTRVVADCTKKYMHPDSTGYITNVRYGSAAALSDTYKVRRGQWTPGVTSIKIRVHARNRDSLGEF